MCAHSQRTPSVALPLAVQYITEPSSPKTPSLRRDCGHRAGYPDVMAHVDAVLKEVDTDGNGEIDYDEFCKMMRSNDGGKLRNSTLRNTMFLPK